jgi:hypothetical protein
MNSLNFFFFRLAIVLAVLMVTIGGMQWLLAIGNAGKIGNAKDTIQQAILGLILALVAVLLFNQIDSSFTEIDLKDIKLTNKSVPCEERDTRLTCEYNDNKNLCKWICTDSDKKEDCCITITDEVSCSIFSGEDEACRAAPGCTMGTNSFTAGRCVNEYDTIACDLTMEEVNDLYRKKNAWVDVQCCVQRSDDGRLRYRWARRLVGEPQYCSSICPGTTEASVVDHVSTAACWQSMTIPPPPPPFTP